MKTQRQRYSDALNHFATQCAGSFYNKIGGHVANKENNEKKQPEGVKPAPVDGKPIVRVQMEPEKVLEKTPENEKKAKAKQESHDQKKAERGLEKKA